MTKAFLGGPDSWPVFNRVMDALSDYATYDKVKAYLDKNSNLSPTTKSEVYADITKKVKALPDVAVITYGGGLESCVNGLDYYTGGRNDFVKSLLTESELSAIKEGGTLFVLFDEGDLK